MATVRMVMVMSIQGLATAAVTMMATKWKTCWRCVGGETHCGRGKG